MQMWLKIFLKTLTFIFEHGEDQKFDLLVPMQLTPKELSEKAKEDLSAEIFKIRKKLSNLTKGEMTYLRTSDNKNLIASSADREAPDVQNARFNLDGKGELVYSTGRIETEHKALQLIDGLIAKSLTSGYVKLDQLVQDDDGNYCYPFLVENLINDNAVAHKERKHLLQQEKVLNNLKDTIRTYHFNGKAIQLKLQPIHFSTQANYNISVGQSEDGRRILKKD